MGDHQPGKLLVTQCQLQRLDQSALGLGIHLFLPGSSNLFVGHPKLAQTVIHKGIGFLNQEEGDHSNHCGDHTGNQIDIPPAGQIRTGNKHRTKYRDQEHAQSRDTLDDRIQGSAILRRCAFLNIDRLHIVRGEESGKAGTQQVHRNVGCQRNQNRTEPHTKGIDDQERTAAVLIAQRLINESQYTEDHRDRAQGTHAGNSEFFPHNGRKDLGCHNGLHLSAQLGDHFIAQVDKAHDQQKIGHIAGGFRLGFFLFPLFNFSLLFFFRCQFHFGALLIGLVPFYCSRMMRKTLLNFRFFCSILE